MKLKLTIVTVSTLLIIFLGLNYMWQTNPKIIETKTFSCEGMEDFTFEYPVFEGWELVEQTTANPALVEPNKCQIVLYTPNYFKKQDQLAIIEITRSLDLKFAERAGEPNKNPYGIDYFSAIEIDRIEFETPNFGITIKLPGADFPKDHFFQTVINSFRITK